MNLRPPIAMTARAMMVTSGRVLLISRRDIAEREADEFTVFDPLR